MGFLLLLQFGSIWAQAQTNTITGVIKDNKGTPMSAVSVMVKGTNKGTQTDANGMFRLDAAGGSALIISYTGYEMQEVALTSAKNYLVTMQLAVATTTEEVVVVGYATQKKVNLTGSVSSISAKQIEDRPVTNVSSSLAGLSSGVYVRQGSGRPGSDGASILIRGNGTLSSNSPLVLIDGVIGTIDAVNPLDIESISVLKDAASASIYGTLAGNGVILITTKKGQKNRTSVTYNGIFSTTSPMNLPSFVTDYARHMRLMNEGYINVGQAAPFALSTIAAWDSTSKIPDQLSPNGVPNRIAYPNTDWSDALFNQRLLQNHNVSVNGGNDKVNFMVSLGYLNNQGTIANTGTKRYQIRANLDAKINKFLTVGTQTFASQQSFDMGNTESAFNFLRQTTPGLVPFYNNRYGFPHATEESSTANNILAFLNNTQGKDLTSRFNTTVYATLSLIKGLTFETRFNYQIRQNESNSSTNAAQAERWNFATGEQRAFLPNPANLSSTYSFDKNYQTVVDNVLRYTTKLGADHEISALVGYNQLYYNFYNFSATKQGLIDYSITVPNAVLTPTNTSGSELDYAIRSWFGRVNYAYKSKYLLEGNLRRDGVSRFSPQTRWGVFPSVSAGWRISQEAFMRGTKNWLSSLKLRASYGEVGNNASGNYDWQATYASRLYSFNNQQASGLASGRYANEALLWETMRVKNIGLDGSLFRNKLFFELDVFQKDTRDILASTVIPLTAGIASAPVENAAQLRNKGFEFTLGYRGKSGDFGYSFSGNFSYNNNTVTKFKGKLVEGYVEDALGNKVFQSNIGAVSAGGTALTLEDHRIGEYFLYRTYRGSGQPFNSDGSVNINGGPKNGMIRTPDDLAWAQAMIAAGYRLLPANAVRNTGLYYGDLVYADLNGDGQYGNSFDRSFTGTSALPKYVFGFNTELSWKNFDLSMIWAGAAGFEYYWNADGYNNSFVTHGNAHPTLVADNRYYYNEANPNDPNNNINGKYPRLKANDPQNRAVPSDFWLYDASWIKLKNLQIGYNLPQLWVSKAAMQRARVYFSAENLLMITSFPGLDPEIGANLGYPTMRQFAFGLNVTF
ncbi:SusC/RagA family TonB-linked outer membrane protein [Phnomibacter sp. MR]|uniref:SusC/RagA family TonB-linked outer membrane protein n=1 Tax=Phnomibacter sp. MR TaxID=3042318 RepID=UPI003A800F0C